MMIDGCTPFRVPKKWLDGGWEFALMMYVRSGQGCVFAFAFVGMGAWVCFGHSSWMGVGTRELVLFGANSCVSQQDRVI